MYPAGHATRDRLGGGDWEQTGFPRGFAVSFPRPAGGVVTHRGVESAREQRVLDVVVAFALLEQREREASGAAPSSGDRRFVEASLGPLGVIYLHRRRQAAHMATLDGGKAAAHGDGGVAVATREFELLESRECAHDWRTRSVALAEPEGL